MISLHASEATSPAVADPMVSRVLDLAVFFYAKVDPVTLATTTFWQLRKDLPPYPAGTVMTLSRLHVLLFGDAPSQ